MYARACDDILVCVKKKEEITIIVFFLFPFSRGKFFLVFFAGTKKISFMKFREKKVEKNREGAEQNRTKTLLSLSLTLVSTSCFE